MHKIQNTPKIITIIGLVFEGLSALILLFTGLFFRSIDKIPGYTESLSDMSADELEIYEFFINFVTNVALVMGIILIGVFILNIYLFTKLINEKFTEEQARKVYLYQAIWGGINLLFNQITGIVYLVSGVQGFNNQKDRDETREGI